MSLQTTKDVLFDFYRNNEEMELDRNLFGEQDIRIPHMSECQPGYSFRHSEFVSNDLENVYIAGITGMNEDSFLPSALYNDFYISTSDWNLKVRDAEKSDSKPKDYHMCWAATDSNLMIQAGWIPSFINDEDELFNLYRNAFKYGASRDGISYDGADWYLTGNYDPIVVDPNNPPDECFPNTGGFFANVITNVSTYLRREESVPCTYTILSNAITYLKQGKAVGLRIAQCKWGMPARGHFITLQGYSYKLITESETTYEIVTGIIVADSDDDKDAIGYGGEHGSSFAPNVVKVIPVHYILGDVFLDYRYMNYTSDGWSPWKISDTTIVTPADFSVVVSNGDIVRQGATLLDEDIKKYEIMNVSTNGLAHNTTVSSGGFLNVLFGASSFNTIVSSGGKLNVSSGGTALNTTVSSHGAMVVSSGGLALQTVLSGGVQNVYSEGQAYGTVVSYGGAVNIYSGGIANQTILDEGNAYVSGGGIMIIDNQITPTGNITLGGVMYKDNVLTDYSDVAISYKLDRNTPVNTPLITNLSSMEGVSRLTLKITWREKYGTYILAQYANGFINNGTLDVYDLHSNSINCSLSGWTNYSFPPAGNTTYTLRNDGADITLEISGDNVGRTTRGDIDYNGKSDTLYVRRNRSETEGVEILYGLDGTLELQDEGILDSDVRIIGGYDMDWNHRVDLVTCRSVEIDSTDCLVIEYAQSGDLNDVQEIDIINNSGNVDWNIYCGNLTGHDWKNSILWHAPDLGILGYWADAGGNASWSTIGSVYDSDWEVLGMGDFSNDSVHKDAVLFKYGINTIVEITASGGFRSLGILGDGWEVATIGDFSNDGVDDLILYNAGSGLVGKWADGVNTGWSSLGTVETGVAIEGAGDYNGDGSMDLLARKSDGTMGYYASANVSQFTSFGYTMDSGWTVIA